MWRLAWRNLWRNRTRTIITGSAIALTLMLRLVTVGLNASNYEKMLQGAEKSAGGAILVHANGYWEARTGAYILSDAARRQAALEQLQEVSVVVPRVMMSGLLSSANGNMGVQAVGIVPEREKAVQDWQRYLTEGTFLGGDGDTAEIVLGKAIVKTLDVELGDRIVLATTDPKGRATQGLFYLGGILSTGSRMTDKGLAFVRLADAQDALGISDGVSQLGVVLTTRDTHASVKPAVERSVALPGANTAEVLTWEEANPQMVKLIESDRKTNDGISWVIMLVVAFGIVNTFLMVVLERVRELGLLGALGMTPGQVARLLLWEGAMLGAVFVGLGLLLGGLAHHELATTGIDMTEVMGEVEIGGVLLEDMHLRSKLVWSQWLSAALGIFGIVVASALYPAFKATRLEPAQAMRTYE